MPYKIEDEQKHNKYLSIVEQAAYHVVYLKYASVFNLIMTHEFSHRNALGATAHAL